MLTTGHGSLSSGNSESCFSMNSDILRIRKQRIDNVFNIIIGHLNFNSMINKFVLVEIIIKAFDIFLISESKLDYIFSCNQIYVAGFKQFRRDRNWFRGGSMLYTNGNICCRPLNEHPKFPNLELIIFELHQSKRKWLFLGMYKSPCKNDSEFLNRIISILTHFLTTFENVIQIGDFNSCVENIHLGATLEHDLSNLINKPFFYQSNNHTFIDLILTNKKNIFNLSDSLSDSHKFISTILKLGGYKGKSKEKVHRSYRQFNSEGFKKDLKFKLSHLTSSSYDDFVTTFF